MRSYLWALAALASLSSTVAVAEGSFLKNLKALNSALSQAGAQGRGTTSPWTTLRSPSATQERVGTRITYSDGTSARLELVCSSSGTSVITVGSALQIKLPASARAILANPTAYSAQLVLRRGSTTGQQDLGRLARGAVAVSAADDAGWVQVELGEGVGRATTKARRLLGLIGTSDLITLRIFRAGSTDARELTFGTSQAAATIGATACAEGSPNQMQVASAPPASLRVDPLSEREEGLAGGGAYCTAKDLRGRTVFAGADESIAKINGKVVKLNGGSAAFGSLRFTSPEGFTVSFARRPGRVTAGMESQTEPSTMTVKRGSAQTSVPVLRECGA